MNTVKFYTLGCKINQYETQVIREQLERAGFLELDDSSPASIYIINTCTVTHRADRNSLYLIRRAYRQNPNAKIIVTGCLAKLDSDKIANLSGVSMIVDNRDKYKIACKLSGEKSRSPEFKGRPMITYFKNHSRAFIKVQDGCDYLCSYCKVRIVRGKSRSRSINDVKQEVRNLVANGYSEIVLSGICLGSYGRDLTPKHNLCQLIEELNNIPAERVKNKFSNRANFRIRLSSIEIGDVTESLIQQFKKCSRLCPHLHIPAQSGDNQILRIMNRTYSRQKFIKIIKYIRRNIPDIAITTDMMVGFPGETDAHFDNSVDLIRQIRPLRVHIFPYSRRSNTPAYKFKNNVPNNKVTHRLSILNKVAQESRLSYFQGFISKTRDALIEGLVPGYSDLWEGFTDNYIKVRVRSKLALKNRIVPVKIKKVYQDFVLAQISSDA